jgi:ATP-dependent Clp protease ATP-binding subunit ClpA
MKPRHSTSLLLVWRVAEVEAKRLNAPEIEPLHLLIGLCKAVNLDLPALVSKDTPDRDDILEELLREVRRLRTIFRTAQVNPTPLRRKLRGTPLDRRFQMEESETLHRTAAAKKVFADAEHFAQLAGAVVYPAHLLYAVLLGDDTRRDDTFKDLGIDKPRFQEVAKREVVFQREDGAAAMSKPKTRWN